MGGVSGAVVLLLRCVRANPSIVRWYASSRLSGVAACSNHSASQYEAQPSFSHACSQLLQVIRSPNHWWASSCEMMSSAAEARRPARLAIIVVADVFSMPPLKLRTSTWAYLSHG